MNAEGSRVGMASHVRLIQNRPARRLARLLAVPDEGRYPQVLPVEESVKPVVEPVRQELTAEAPVIDLAPEPPTVSLVERIGNGAVFGVTAFFGGTFLIALATYVRNYNKPEARARRKLLKNQRVVRTLAEQLPASREKVTRGMLRQLGFVTGFSAVEIFRKFLWYVLKDRKFDQAAVDDLIHLRQELQLSNEDVAEALKERCVRIEKKFGNLMLTPTGLTEKAVQRKATCRALFSKMLYLIENESILKENDVLSVDVLRKIFGATEEDIAQLKIVTIQDVDIDVLDSMVGRSEEG